MNREYYKWFSPNLQRDMELLVFGHAGEPVLFFPTRTAHFYDYEDWLVIEALRRKIEGGNLQIFCLDSIDNRTLSNALWEKGIWNALNIWDGESHKAKYWRHMVQLYL